jgi:hypothetical protein
MTPFLHGASRDWARLPVWVIRVECGPRASAAHVRCIAGATWLGTASVSGSTIIGWSRMAGRSMHRTGARSPC